MAAARSAEASATRRSLSKNVMQMKFMIRGKEQVTESSEGKSKKRHDSEWVVGGVDQITKNVPYSFDTSYVECEELLPYGRMSFLNFNPSVEKKYKELLHKANMKLSGDREDFDGISDEEMAERYETLVDTVAKKFKSKGKRKSGDNSASSDEEEGEDSLAKRAKRGFVKPRTQTEDFEF